MWLTLLYKLLFFFKALWSSCRALTHRTRSVSLSVSISCVRDSPGGVIWDAVTCHRQHTSDIRACTYKENRRTCLIFYSKKQETRNKKQRAIVQELWQDWRTYPENAIQLFPIGVYHIWLQYTANGKLFISNKRKKKKMVPMLRSWLSLCFKTVFRNQQLKKLLKVLSFNCTLFAWYSAEVATTGYGIHRNSVKSH